MLWMYEKRLTLSASAGVNPASTKFSSLEENGVSVSNRVSQEKVNRIEII
jgi:hypothetical protein